MTGNSSEWISAYEASKILHVHPKTFSDKVAPAAAITVWRVPGLHPRYLRSDVERVAAEAIQRPVQR